MGWIVGLIVLIVLGMCVTCLVAYALTVSFGHPWELRVSGLVVAVGIPVVLGLWDPDGPCDGCLFPVSPGQWFFFSLIGGLLLYLGWVLGVWAGNSSRTDRGIADRRRPPLTRRAALTRTAVVTTIVGVTLLLIIGWGAGAFGGSEWSNDSPSWSPDGRQIVFVRDPCPGGGFFCPDYDDIVVMRRDGSGLHRLRRIRGPVTLDLSPVWSPDGERIAFANGAIYIMSVDGSVVRRLPHSAPDAEPRWSPNGRKIAFINEAREDHSRIGVMEPDGRRQRLLTPASDDDFAPTWSPDGRQIAFISRDNYAIEVMNSDGSNAHRLATVRGDTFQLAWSPDGRRIAYTDGSNIHVIDADGRNSHALTRAGGEEPAWSPDGRTIAFETFRDHADKAMSDLPEYLDEIYIMNADGSNQQRLTH
jgi:Tol biopolymer transport system component